MEVNLHIHTNKQFHITLATYDLRKNPTTQQVKRVEQGSGKEIENTSYKYFSQTTTDPQTLLAEATATILSYNLVKIF
jgi:hypothetical protein